jgi:hypothetical protein
MNAGRIVITVEGVLLRWQGLPPENESYQASFFEMQTNSTNSALHHVADLIAVKRKCTGEELCVELFGRSSRLLEVGR